MGMRTDPTPTPPATPKFDGQLQALSPDAVDAGSTFRVTAKICSFTFNCIESLTVRICGGSTTCITSTYPLGVAVSGAKVETRAATDPHLEVVTTIGKPIQTAQEAVWSWYIKAKEPGSSTIFLVSSALDPDEKQMLAQGTVLEVPIVVRRNLRDTLLDIGGTVWSVLEKLLAALGLILGLLPLVNWFNKRRRGKSRRRPTATKPRRRLNQPTT
jgi:hypothetical protein